MTKSFATSGQRILVIGAGGFLGANLVLTALEKCHVIAHSRTGLAGLAGVEQLALDLRELEKIESLVSSARPDVVINCSALADVDACERDPQGAFMANAEVPALLATACQCLGVRFVHISTDAVFGGTEGPQGESSPVSPINVYGRTKADGEIAVLRECRECLVVRTNFYGWSPSGSRSLLEFFVNTLDQGQDPSGFIDIEFRPLAVQFLWPLISGWLCESLQVDRRIRHATGLELIPKYEFGRQVAACFGYSIQRVRPVSSEGSSLVAQRGKVLDVRPSELPQDLAGGKSQISVAVGLEELKRQAEQGFRSRIAQIGSL